MKIPGQFSVTINNIGYEIALVPDQAILARFTNRVPKFIPKHFFGPCCSVVHTIKIWPNRATLSDNVTIRPDD